MAIELSEIETLKKAGLTDSQAKAYMALIQCGMLTPAALSGIISESRTNSYSILSRLEELGLAIKKDSSKTAYTATHPSSLETLAEKRRKTVQRNEEIIKQNVGRLIDIYYTNNEMPGSRTLFGIEGIKEVYYEAISAKKDVQIIRSTSASDAALGREFWKDYRDKLQKYQIHTYALTQDTKSAREHMINRDKSLNFHRTLMPLDAYTAPVAIQVFGDKTAFMSFGETQIATLINSPVIADAMRQIMQTMTEYYKENYSQDPNK